MNSRPVGIVNLLSAVIVLVAGFYVLIFLPLPFSGGGRLIVGALLVVYFLWRLKYFFGRYGKRRESLIDPPSDRDKIT